MTRWEYMILNLPHGDMPAKLNEYGAQGWELVSFQVVDNSRNSVAVLRREVQEPVKSATRTRKAG